MNMTNEDFEYLPINSRFNSLTCRAFADLQERFRMINHSPSHEMLNGLYNLQDTLSGMLTGELENLYYVSSLDPGVGKTTAIMKWLNVYLKYRHEYGDKGVIICFDRLEEIKRFTEDNDLPSDSFAVLVSDDSDNKLQERFNGVGSLKVRGLGCNHINQAPVLLTTKAKIIKESLGGRKFQNIKQFYYQDEPRQIKVWDESLTVGRELLVSDFKVLNLVYPVSKSDTELAQAIRDFSNELSTCKDKDVITVPDFGEVDLRYSFRWSDNDQRETADTLSMLSGKVATVRTDGKGRLALDCSESIPDDFKPCLVTDASARIRETYKLQEEYRKDVRRLEPEHSCKTYKNLRVHVWNRASGKETYRKEGVEGIAKEVIEVILQNSEEYLVVVSKEFLDRMKKAILQGIPKADHGRVKFIHWGIHTATNDYCKVPNVILTSQLYYRPADYEVGARAASGLTTAEGSFSEDRIKQYIQGETAHHILQCVCRGLVRNSLGSDCPVSNAWIIAPKMMKVEEMLPEIFPSCTIKQWKADSVKIKPIVEQMKDYILERLQGAIMVPASDVRKRFGVSDATTFKRDYLRKTDFIDFLESNNILLSIEGGRPFFQLNPFC